MVLRETGLVVTLLLTFVLVSIDGATIATRINSTAEERRSVVPLVVSIPSKVFRANKLNTNDVFERPIIFEPVQESRLPTANELMESQQQDPFPTRIVPETTTEELTTTVATTTSTTEPSSTTTTTTTTTEAPNVDVIEFETEETEVSIPVSTTSTTTAPSTTEEMTTSSSSSSTEEEMTSTPETVVNVTSTKNSHLDEVVEKDYGQSLGFNEQSGSNGNSEGQLEIEDPESTRNEEETNPEPEESESDIPSEVSEAETPSEVVAEERSGLIDAVVEVDAMEEAAQASELDYAIVAPFEHGGIEESRDFSAFHGPRGDFAEHRSMDWAVEDQKDFEKQTGTSTERVAIEKSSSEANKDDVRTSMSYSVAVMHPLGEFEDGSTPIVAVPMKTVQRKKILDESTTFLDKKMETSDKPTTDSIVVVMDAKQVRSSDEDSGNSTLLVLDMTPEDNNSNGSSSESRSSQNTFYRRRHQPWKTSGQLKDEGTNKDLVPEESVQEPVLLLEPNARKVDDEDAAAAPSETVDVLDSDLAAEGHEDPDVVPDEGEYEYVYEYIDLNSTDLPENLPEGAVIVTDDQLATGRAIGQLKPPVMQPLDDVLVNTSAVVTEGAIDVAQPATFRTLNPPVAINTADLSLTLINSTVVPSNESPIVSHVIQPISEELPISTSSDSTLPFIPGMPESPIYFVGIQREKISPEVVAEDRSPVVPIKDVVSGPLSPNSLQDNNSQLIPSSKGSKEQLMSLYALSQALPLDQTSPFLNLINENGSSSVILSPDLPDPFSEEFLGGTDSNISVSAAEAIATTELPVTIKITTSVPSTEPVTVPTTTSEETVTKPTEKAPARGSRPRGSRRSSTVASTTVDETTTTASPVTEAARRARPTRVGGRRRSSTAATTVDTASTATQAEENEATTERTRFGGRGRGRFSGNRGNRPNSAASDLEPEVNGQKESDKESNTIAPNGVKRVFTGRRTTLQPNGKSTANNTMDKEDKPTRVTSRPARGRRPTTARVATKATEEKVTLAPSDTGDETDEGVTRKAALFRARGRGRFGPKSKGTTNEAETGVSTEQSVSEVEVEAEQKEESAQESTVEPEVDSADGTTTVVDDEGAEEGAETTTEASGPPRKFPPRFRPGSRATIPHRTTEPSA